MSGSSLPQLPAVVTAAGLQPQAPATLNAQLLALVASVNPGYTSNLPGSLIEDIGSTDTGAMVLIDQARVETVNSLTPLGANLWLMLQLGQIYGVPQGQASNTSVYVVFTGTPQFIIAQGFTVSDGTYQYVLPDGGIVGQGGTSLPLQAIATISGTWAIPTGTVTQILTSLPSTIALTVTNPLAGTPGAAAQTAADYRSAVLQAGLAASQGMLRYLKNALINVPGVQQRLVSVLQNSNGWEIIVGGSADPYQIGYAIFSALFDLPDLTGSVLAVTGITAANPAVITTDLNHGYATGQSIEITGVTGTIASIINNRAFTATVISPTTFSVGVNTTGLIYASGGVVTPNFRNAVATVLDYPNSYDIPFVIPPQQTVGIAVTWNTTATNPVSVTAVAQAAAPALASYINSIVVGQPINIYLMQATFAASVAAILPASQLDVMTFAVSINGLGVSPVGGTGIIPGDPESYFYTNPTGSAITVTQG